MAVFIVLGWVPIPVLLALALALYLTAIADDNLYTNLMAARNLSEAADATARHPERARTLGVDEADIESWREAAQAIAMP